MTLLITFATLSSAYISVISSHDFTLSLVPISQQGVVKGFKVILKNASSRHLTAYWPLIGSTLELHVSSGPKVRGSTGKPAVTNAGFIVIKPNSSYATDASVLDFLKKRPPGKFSVSIVYDDSYVNSQAGEWKLRSQVGKVSSRPVHLLIAKDRKLRLL